MGYTAMRGGLAAIERAEALLLEIEPDAAPDLSAPRLRDHLRAAVDRAMGEGGLYDRDLAALALRQAEGDSMEATLLLRAYRSTLPRLAYSEPCDGDELDVVRRITPAFKSAPGGQLLGRTRDYSQRLLDNSLAAARERTSPWPDRRLRGSRPVPPLKGEGFEDGAIEAKEGAVIADSGAQTNGFQLQPNRVADVPPPFQGGGQGVGAPPRFPKLASFLREEGLLEEQPADDATAPYDITRDPLRFPAQRSARLQSLARGDTGAMVALAYSTMRGFGVVHSTLCEVRVGYLPVRVRHPYTGDAVRIGEIEVTEVEDLNLSKHTGAGGEEATQFSLGFGLVFGQNERKAIAMALLDRAMESGRAGVSSAPASDEEFVLYHIDGVEGSGFLEHLKLPHYVEFQAYAQRMRVLREVAANGLVPGRNAVAAPQSELAGVAATASAADGHTHDTPDDDHSRTHRLGIEH